MGSLRWTKIQSEHSRYRLAVYSWQRFGSRVTRISLAFKHIYYTEDYYIIIIVFVAGTENKNKKNSKSKEREREKMWPDSCSGSNRFDQIKAHSRTMYFDV